MKRYAMRVSERSKPASKERMKSSHFEERIALMSCRQHKDAMNSTQRELAAFHNDFGSAWLFPLALRVNWASTARRRGTYTIAGSKPASPLTGSLVAGRQSLCVSLQVSPGG